MENSNGCANDYLQIDNEPKVCGTDLPAPFFKKNADANIRFHSNDQLQVVKLVLGQRLQDELPYKL